MYNVTILTIKFTFLAQYYRLMAVQTLRTVCVVVALVVGVWSFSQILLAIFQCAPIAKFWDRTIEGRCLNIHFVWYLTAGGNISTDILVFILPMPVLYKLQLPRGQKIFLLGVFCLGFLYVWSPAFFFIIFYYFFFIF